MLHLRWIIFLSKQLANDYEFKSIYMEPLWCITFSFPLEANELMK